MYAGIITSMLSAATFNVASRRLSKEASELRRQSRDAAWTQVETRIMHGYQRRAIELMTKFHSARLLSPVVSHTCIRGAVGVLATEKQVVLSELYGLCRNFQMFLRKM